MLPEQIDLVLEHLPPRTRQLVEIRAARVVEPMSRIIVSPVWPTPSRTSERQIGSRKTVEGRWTDDTIAAQLDAHGLGHLVNNDAMGRQVFVGFHLDKTSKPILTRRAWEYLLGLDPDLRNLAERGIVVAEDLDEDSAADALIEQWNLNSTPRSRSIELLPRKGIDTSGTKTRNRIRRTRKRTS